MLGQQLRHAVCTAIPLVLGPTVLRTQADTGAPAPPELVAQARAQLRARNPDSAAVLLRRVTDAAAPATPERVQAWVLLGVTAFYSQGDSAASAAFRHALALDPGVDVAGLDRYDPEIATLFARARAAFGAGDSAAARPGATAPAAAVVYECMTKCPEGVVPPAFTFFPYQQVLDGVVLPARRAHVFVTLQAVVDQSGLVEPESVRLVSSTAVGVRGQIERALPQARFRPGWTNGAGVRTRVQLRFDFEAEGTGMIAYTYRVVAR